jgi:hypothetical protein
VKAMKNDATKIQATFIIDYILKFIKENQPISIFDFGWFSENNTNFTK